MLFAYNQSLQPFQKSALCSSSLFRPCPPSPACHSDLFLPGCQSGNEWHKSVSNLSLPYGITDITVFSQTVLMICANRVTKVYIVFFLFIYKKLFFLNCARPSFALNIIRSILLMMILRISEVKRFVYQ